MRGASTSPRPWRRCRCRCRCQFLCQSVHLAPWVRDDPGGVVLGVLNGDRVRARLGAVSRGDVVGVLGAGESRPSVCSLLAEAEEVGNDWRGGRAQQMCDGAVAAVSDRQRTELLDQSTSEALFGDGCASDPAWEQPSCPGVVKSAALRRARELPDELVNRFWDRELIATELDADVPAALVDALDPDPGNAREWLAVEQNQEPSDTDAQLERVVIEQTRDQRETLPVGELDALVLLGTRVRLELWCHPGLARPAQKRSDQPATGSAVSEPAVDVLLPSGREGELLVVHRGDEIAGHTDA
jgi:hypothetical protein